MKLTPQLAKKIGTKLGMDFSKIPFDEFFQGMKIETEHKYTVGANSNDPSLKDWVTYGKIALDHLKERPDYYTMLKKVENESIIRDVIKEVVLTEIRYPPRAIDYNKLEDADGFWGWNVEQAARAAGLINLHGPKRIADLILWLNMASLAWTGRNVGK
jgi:hypothetical protein